MAQQISGKLVARAPIKPRRQFLPEATAAAQATGEILTRRFGSQPWIEQVFAAVQNAVQNGIENLSGSSLSSNAHPSDPYRFRARTKEEIEQSQAIVPAVSAADLPPEDESAGVLVPRGRVIVPGPPPKAKPKAPEGWIL